MTNLRDLTYEPLTAQPSKEEIDAYLGSRRVAGYDEATGYDLFFSGDWLYLL